MNAAHSHDIRALAEASRLEHEILDHVKQALRITLEWKAPTIGLPRKVSSVQFTMRSFTRHLLRMMELEERDGYMTVVLEEKPNLDVHIRRLRRNHDEFRRQLDEMSADIDALPALADDQFEYVCSQIAELLNQVDQHDFEEIELLQDTLLYDEGGEGG
jgi:hypothetical protein